MKINGLKFSRWKRERGFSVIEIIGFISFVGVASYVVMNLGNVAKRNSQSSQVSFSGETLSKKIQNVLKNDGAWAVTVAKNAAMSGNPLECLHNGADCRGKSGPINVYDASGSLLVDSLSSAEGFSSTGLNCTGFDEVNGNDKCPFRAVVSWEANNCPAPPASCESPKVKLTGKFLYKPAQSPDRKKALPFNQNKYAFAFLRGEGVAGMSEGTTEKLVVWLSNEEIGPSAFGLNGDYLGVNTNSPQAKLAVEGGVAIGAYAGAVPAPADSLIVSGAMGVGNADPAAKVVVEGSLRVADDEGECGTENVGAIRYRNNGFEGCFPSREWCPMAGCPSSP